jgi:ABC-2 type transport system ATP-binding protein
MPVIEFHNVTKHYGRTRALDRLELAVAAGELTGFLGPNGAGKTTAMRILVGLMRPTAGTARLLSADSWRASPKVRDRIGYLPGTAALYGRMTARAYLAYFARYHGPVDWPWIESLAARLDLDLAVRVAQASRGNQQKVALISALAHRPELLILDEPTTGLDPLTQRQVLGLLRELNGQGTTVFMSSHTLSQVEYTCGRVAVIKQGRLVALDEVEALRRRAERKVTVAFAGPAPEPPTDPAVRVLERNERRLVLAVQGSPDPVLKWLARYPIEDVTIEKPSLETLFMRYYEAEEAGSREPRAGSQNSAGASQPSP